MISLPNYYYSSMGLGRLAWQWAAIDSGRMPLEQEDQLVGRTNPDECIVSQG